MEGRIVPLTSEHLDGCARLFVSVFNGEPWNDCWTFATARQRLSDVLHTPGYVGFVLLKEEEVGFVVGNREQWDKSTTFNLREMCVRTDRQRQGIGTRLIQCLEGALSARGVANVYLLTMKGDQAEAFYRKNGYRTSHRNIVMSHRL